MEAASKERLWQSLESLFNLERLENLFRRIPKALKRQLALDQLNLLWVDNMFKSFRQSRWFWSALNLILKLLLLDRTMQMEVKVENIKHLIHKVSSSTLANTNWPLASPTNWVREIKLR